MKKVLLRTIGALLLITALIVFLVPSSDVEATSSTSDFEIEGNKLVKYKGTSEIVSIPDDIKSIGEEAFEGNGNLVKVEIGNKVRDIGYAAFRNCPNLRVVTMGDKVENVGQASFANCKELNSVTFGPNVKSIGSGVFAGDDNLKNVGFSDNKHFIIENNVIYDNKKEKLICMLPEFKDGEYVMPSSVNEVNGYAFWGNRYIKNVSVSSNLYSVPEYAFSNCVSLKQVTIPLPVHSIDAKAFEDCVNLSLVSCPDSLTNISPSAFDGCPYVTLSATPGSYADEYNSKIQRSEISETEYEDVEGYQTVSQVDLISSISENANEVTQENIDDSVSGNDINEKPTAKPTPLLPKYSNGVINGADVVTYTYYADSTAPEGDLLGSSSVVAGRALVFIDNSAKVYGNESADGASENASDSGESDTEVIGKRLMGTIDLSKAETKPAEESNEEMNLGNIIADDAQKGLSFPKFTVVNSKIAQQSYYGDQTLETYEFPEGITGISDFAFARSSLSSIEIPEGVTEIGYGAFYHCDNLKDVSIPSTVNKISQYAFEETAFLNDYADPFVILGDGVLIAYKGSDSVVTIPDGVTMIADGTFKDHMGITAVNFPDSLLSIGEEAFMGCRNLNTVNRGDNIESIGDCAFMDTALNNVTIGPNVKSIGLGAFALDNGTDTVTFRGNTLPELTFGRSAERLSDSHERALVFGDIKTAIVPNDVSNIQGSVLEPGRLGFDGIVVNEIGNTVSDNTVGPASYVTSGVLFDVNSSNIIPDANSYAQLPGNEDAFVLHISDSQNAKESIEIAYADLYGGKKPDNLIGFDIKLNDSTDSIPIRKLGKQKLNVKIPLPQSVTKNNLHVVCLDNDGQLESVDFTTEDINDISYVTFSCEHFSPYGFYNYSGANEIVKEGDHIKDDTPDTGDYGPAPRIFLVIAIAALGIAVILYSFRKKQF